MHEQRRHKRLGVNEDFASIDELMAEYVTDISRGGVFIRSKQPLPVGTNVNLKFSVFLDDFETIEGEGEVVRMVQGSEDEPSGMGVIFTKLTDHSRSLIEEIVRRNEEQAEDDEEQAEDDEEQAED